MGNRIKVVVAEENREYLEMICNTLASSRTFELCGSCADGKEALALVKEKASSSSGVSEKMVSVSPSNVHIPNMLLEPSSARGMSMSIAPSNVPSSRKWKTIGMPK